MATLPICEKVLDSNQNTYTDDKCHNDCRIENVGWGAVSADLIGYITDVDRDSQVDRKSYNQVNHTQEEGAPFFADVLLHVLKRLLAINGSSLLNHVFTVVYTS